MKLILINLLRKITSSVLILLMGFSLVTFMGLQEVGAVNDFIIVVGNHNEGEPTNMMMQFQLTEDFLGGDTYYIDFEDTVDLTNMEIFDPMTPPDDIRFELDSDAINNDNEVEITWGMAPDDISIGINVSLSRIGFSLMPGSTTISAGNYIRIFIGPEDGFDLYNGGTAGNGYDIVSGADDDPPASYDDFACSAGTTIGSGLPCQPIIMPTDVSDSYVIITKPNAEEVLGSFAVFDDVITSQELTMNVTLDPYITLNVTDSSLALGSFTSINVGRDTATLEIETNAEFGYVLRYSATELTGNSIDIGRKNPKGTLSTGITGEWGINLAANTVGGNEGAVPTLTTPGKGTDPSNMVEANYNTPDQYYLANVSTLDKLIENPNPTGDTLTITAAVLGNSLMPAGNYEATVTMNVYATF